MQQTFVGIEDMVEIQEDVPDEATVDWDGICREVRIFRPMYRKNNNSNNNSQTYHRPKQYSH